MTVRARIVVLRHFRRLDWWPHAAAAGVLHGVVLLGLVWRPALLPPRPPDDQAVLQVEYVNRPDEVKGAPAPDPAADPAVTPSATAAQASQAAPPPPPPDPDAAVPLPAQSQQAAVAEGADAMAAVNLGDADQDQDALSVTGDNVVSSGPDAKFRNLPPAYPREAVQLHQQGTVVILVHVTPTGEAGEIEMVASSGSPALDDAALAAITKWHFKPAIRAGVPVASVYPMQMNFRDVHR